MSDDDVIWTWQGIIAALMNESVELKHQTLDGNYFMSHSGRMFFLSHEDAENIDDHREAWDYVAEFLKSELETDD